MAKHFDVVHTMSNGHDWLRFEEAAVILLEVLGGAVAYDGSYGEFVKVYGSMTGPLLVQTMWNLSKFEEAHEEIWALNNLVERTTGRKRMTVEEWLMEHKDALMRGTEGNTRVLTLT